MMRRVVIGLTLLAVVVAASAQEPATALRTFTHITQLGIGRVLQQDTYLSPLEYRGLQAHYMHQRHQPLQWFKRHVQFQSLFHVEGSYTKNRPKKANYMGGSLRYDAAWLYKFITPHSSLDTRHSSLQLLAGPQIGGTLGFLYNTHNGNNPAQALADIHLSASAMATYGFRLWRHSFKLSNQVDVPLIGAMFSPNYSQSYYEIFSEGNTDHNICMTTPFNAPSLRNQLSFDFPIGRFTFRTSYLIDVRQSHVNGIKHHSYSHAFMVGWVKRMYN